MIYEEYENRIKELFMECGHSEEVKDTIREGYEYLDNELVGASVTPEAVASTLDLLY